MPLVCVLNAEVEIKAKTGEILITQVAVIPSVTQCKLWVGSKPVLTEEDIKQWAMKFITNYDFGSFNMGVLSFKDQPTFEKIAEKMIYKNKFVIKSTLVSLYEQATAPAIDPKTNSADTDPLATLTVTFTNPGQSKLDIK